jgi:hypothetical protein
MFDLLDRVATDGPTEVDRWRSMHARLNDQRCRRDPVHSSFLDPLEPEHHVARWARFPQDLLAAAFHLADTPAERRAATRALLDAVPLAPSLVTRSLLLAALIHKL